MQGKGPLIEKPKGKPDKEKKAMTKPKSSPGAIYSAAPCSKPDSTNNKGSASTPSKDPSSKEVSTPKQRGRKPSAAKSIGDVPGTPKMQESPKASTAIPSPVVATPTVTTAASSGSSTTVTDEGLTRGAVAAETLVPAAVPPRLSSPFRESMLPQSHLNSSPLNLPSASFVLTPKCMPSTEGSSPQLEPQVNSVKAKQENEPLVKEKEAEKEKLTSKEKTKEKPSTKETAKVKNLSKEKKQLKDKIQQKDKVQNKEKGQLKEKRPGSATTKKRPSKPSEDEPKRKVGRPPKSSTLKNQSTSPVRSPISVAGFHQASSPFNTSVSPLQAGNTAFQNLVPQNVSTAASVPTNMQNGVRSPVPGDYVVPQPRHVGSMENRSHFAGAKAQNNTPL